MFYNLTMLTFPLGAPPYEASEPPLPWGYRYLMCPPQHFDIEYEINPWMNAAIGVDRHKARAQWDALAATLRAAGATVECMDPQPHLPDLVFTANAGIVIGDRAVVARFRNVERRDESAHDAAWFSSHGFTLQRLPGELVQEGAGDALPFSVREGAAPMLLAGHGIRSERGAIGALGRMLSVRVEPLQLVDPRLYHLDLAFCPLGPGRAMVAPAAFDARSRRRLEALITDALVLDLDEALTFCANSVVVGTTVIMPSCPPRVARRLEAWGYDVTIVAVDEFRKAGGAVRCLTLPLDIRFGNAAARAAA